MPEWVRGTQGRIIHDKQMAANGAKRAENYFRNALREEGPDMPREVNAHAL
jgi:hypothetical protein